MGHPKDIFKNRGPLTEQEIKDYLSGKLNDQQRKAIELKMAQDEFNMAAMAGFEESPEAMKGFENIKGQIHSNIAKKGKKWQFHHTLIVSVALMGLTMLASKFIFPDHGQTTLPEETQEEVLTPQDTVAEEPVIVEELSDEEIEKAVVLDPLNIVHASEVIVSSPVIIDSTLQEDPAQEELAIQESIEIKKVANTGLSNIEVPTKDDIIYSNVPLIYINNFLLVDYSKIYITPPTVEQTQIFGTSPALENKEDSLSDIFDDNIQTIEISYKDYLGETQELFEKHEFKTALKRYKVIMNKYPEDLNAHFYSALCYYNIGKYDLALQHFKIARNHPFNTFEIDAEWYTAKTLNQMGKTTACKKLLNKIIDGGQYYAPQAQKLLDQL